METVVHLLTYTDDYLEKNNPEALVQRNKYWTTFSKYIDDPRMFTDEGRAELLQMIAQELKIDKKTARKWLRRGMKCGFFPNAFLDRLFRMGAPGQLRIQIPGQPRLGNFREFENKDEVKAGIAAKEGIPITKEIKVYFREAVEKIYNNAQGHFLTDVLQEVKESHFSDKIDGIAKPWPESMQPSYWQLYRWYRNEYLPEKSERARSGNKSFKSNHRTLPGKAADFAFYPGMIDCIDWAKLPITLRYSQNRNYTLDNIRIYWVVDGNCGFIRAFTLTLEEDTFMTEVSAVLEVYTSRVPVYSHYKITLAAEDYPHYRAPILLSDRTPGLMNHHAANFKNVGVTPSPLESLRPDQKPWVEVMTSIVRREVISFLPGSELIRRNRDQPSSQEASRLIYPELHKVLLSFAVTFNNTPLLDYPLLPEMREAGIIPTPLNLVKFGIQRHGPLPPMSPRDVHLALAPKGKATIHRNLIIFKEYGPDLRYDSKFAHREKWFKDAEKYGPFEVDVAYHSLYPTVIYLMPNPA